MDSMYTCILLLGCVAVPLLSSSVRISRCEVCDDATPGRHCFNTSLSENCLGATPYCGTRLVSTQGKTALWKGCASEQTCVAQWWQDTRDNPSCTRAAVTSGHVTDGVTCFFCCHEASPGGVYCNDAVFPVDLAQFPGVTAPPTTTAPTTPQPATATTPTTAPTTVTTTALQPTHVQCPVCVSDSTTGQQCDVAAGLDLCDVTAQFCMTSFYRQPSGVRVEKRCATRHDCAQRWLVETKTDSACVTPGLSVGNGSALECHYCCHGHPSGSACNSHSHDVIPTNLMGAGHSTATPPSTSDDYQGGQGHNQPTGHTPVATTPVGAQLGSTTSSPHKHAMECIVCTTDSASSQTCVESSSFDVCPSSSEHYCMTSFYRSPTTYRVEKSCATRDECQNKWWGSTLNKTGCLDPHLSPGSGSELECHYCCFSPDPAQPFCNDDHGLVMPKNLITMSSALAVTTASPTTTTTTTTTTPMPSTTPISAPTSVETTTHVSSGTGARCQVCMQDPSSLQFCQDGDVQTCGDPSETLCLNTITFSPTSVSVQKSCASAAVCQSDKTRVDPLCLQPHPASPAGHPDLVCSYCCNASHVTGTPCNVFDRPLSTVDFTTPPPLSTATTPTTTTAPTTTTVSITTPTTTTASTTAATTTATTTAPTTTAATTTLPTTTATTSTEATTATAGPSVSCAVCDHLCIFFQKEAPCPAGFCMTSVTDDDHFSRVVTKSCVTEDECYKRWWQETSDQNVCLKIMAAGNSPLGVAARCNFCCYGDHCNVPSFPTKATLYNGYNKGTYPIG